MSQFAAQRAWAHQNYACTRTVLLKVFDPHPAAVKAVLVGEVEHDDCAACIAVVQWCQRSVPLLPGCVPHIHPQTAAVHQVQL